MPGKHNHQRIRILLLLFLIPLTGILAQDDGTEVIQFGSPAPKADVGFFANSIIKTSPTSPIGGLVILEFEKELNSFLSGQVGVGLTFKDSDPISGIYDELLKKDPEIENDHYFAQDFSDYEDEDITETKLGIAFSASTRFFISDAGYNGLYLAPTVFYRKDNYEKQGIVHGLGTLVRDPNTVDKESVSTTFIGLRAGHQLVGHRFMYETFIGLGYSLVKESRQDTGRKSNGVVDSRIREYSYSNPDIEIGIRIGVVLY